MIIESYIYTVKKSIWSVFKAIFLLSVGWIIGYIRLPDILAGNNFWFGFSLALALAFSLLLVLRFLNKSSSTLVNGSGYVKIALGAIIFLLLVVAYQFSGRRNFENELTEKSKEIEVQKNLVESEKQKRLLPLVDQLITTLNIIANNDSSQIDNQSLSLIKGLNKYFTPYQYRENKTLLEKKVSPERGYLLLSLLNSDLDSASLVKVFREVSFEGSSLRNADLSGYDLRNINLDGSDLQGADLSHSLLSGASLQGVNFTKANLSNAILDSCIFDRSIADWAIFSGASLIGSRIEGCHWSYAKLDSAQLSGSRIKNVNLEGAILSYSDFDSAMLYYDTLSGVDLSFANFKVGHISRTLIDNIKVDSTSVNTFWIEKENPNKLIGLDLFIKKYQLYVNKNGDSLMIVR